MIFGLLGGVATAVMVWFLGLPLSWGAHPFWATKVIVYGAPVGLLVVMATHRLRHRTQILATMVMMGVTGAVAYQGKTIFAASYAENAFAGQAWFFGWIGLCAAVVALGGALARAVFERR